MQQSQMNEKENAAKAEGVSGLGRDIAHIAGALSSGNFSPGVRARFSRMNPEDPPPLCFYNFAIRHLPEGWEARERDWRTLICGMALMSPSIHRPNEPFGRALAEIGFSEIRMERLLSATGRTRRDLFLKSVRLLAAKARPFNWLDAAMLLFATGNDSRERTNRSIAKSFYASAHRKS